MIKTTVITPTIGTPELKDAIISVQEQTVRVNHLVVVDGFQYLKSVKKILNKTSFYGNILTLPYNTGVWNGEKWNGHRIYSGIPAIVNTEFVCFLDEDNYMAPDYVKKMEKVLTDNPLWVATCRRHVVRQDKSYIGVDNFESIGENEMGYALHDTNTYLFRTEPYCSVFANHFYDTLGADKLVTEQVYRLSNLHRHLPEPLVYYRSPERLYEFFEDGCTK